MNIYDPNEILNTTANYYEMDTLSNNFIDKRNEKVKVNDEFSIGCLELIDDVLSCTIGMKDQISVLNIVDDFGRKRKLEWGEAKSQVMQHAGRREKKMEIGGQKHPKHNSSYKYLGDTITNDNKNKRNLEIRERKIQGTIKQINKTASSDIMRGIETKVLYLYCIRHAL